MTDKILTLTEIKELVKEYPAVREEKRAENLQDILMFTSQLSRVEQSEIIKSLGAYNAIHGMNKRELQSEISCLLRSTVETPFFEGDKLKPIRVVDALQRENEYLTTVEDGQLRVYREGVFAVDETRETAREIIEMLGEDVQSSAVSNVLSLLSYISMSAMPEHKDWVNLKNGRWCLNSWNLLEHSPIHKSIVQLPVAYNPKAKCPEFNQWISDVLPNEDDQFLLLQLFGYSMLQDVRFGKLVVLFGPTHTGKSTCLDLLKLFLGKEHVSALSLHALDNEERRFARSGLVGKLANVSADLSSKFLSGDSQVKQISVGDPMQIEFKGIQGFTYSPFATLWASSNQLPVSHDRTDAWYERLLILPFVNQHKGKNADSNLLQRISQPCELSGLLNLVLDALKVLLSENAFQETDSTREMLDQYRRANDHVSRFLSEGYELAEDAYVLEDDLYAHYEKDWCEAEGIKPLSKTKFREGVIKWGSTRKRKGSSQRFFVFDGMTAQ